MQVACRKYAGHDLKNQKRLQSFSIDGLHTVIQMLVDFKGVREYVGVMFRIFRTVISLFYSCHISY